MFRIEIDTSRVERFIRKLPKNIRKRGRSGLKEFGDGLVIDLLNSANRAGIKQFRRSRSMFTSTRYVQQKNNGYVFMPMSGFYQDRAKDHWVPVSRKHPMAYAWAKQKGFEGSGFMFRKKPFIQQGKRNAMRRLMPIMRPAMNAAIRESH